MATKITIDFTAYRHPVLAVACPTCHATPGFWCKRPSEHTAADFHADRKHAADECFIEQHGVSASIDKTHNGWKIDPVGRTPTTSQADFFNVTGSEPGDNDGKH